MNYVLIVSPCSLGIELTKILVLQYSNQETSVTIGESVRDEDGMISTSDRTMAREDRVVSREEAKMICCCSLRSSVCDTRGD